jgi:hypothetical protein
MTPRRTSATGHHSPNNAAAREEQQFPLEIIRTGASRVDQDPANTGSGAELDSEDSTFSSTPSESQLDPSQEDDALQATARRSHDRPPLLNRMSKSPLLLRNSPGLGSGSYGAAPIGVSTDPSEDEDDNLQHAKSRRSTIRSSMGGSRRSKRRLKPRGTEHDAGSGSIRLRRSRSRLSRDISRRSSMANTLEGVDDLGITSRYGLAGIPLHPEGDESDASTKGGDDGEESDIYEDDSFDEEDPPDNSRYAQVRASVSALDDTTLSINTPRMWILSMVFAILGSSTNLFFSLRYPSVSITPVIALLLVHPLGLLWDKFLKRQDDPEELFVHGVLIWDADVDPIDIPDQDSPSSSLPVKSYKKPVGSWRRRLRLWLAQGRWNEKEHSCVYISSNVSFGFAFATDVIIEQTHFYKQEVSITYQILLILSTQILGYTFAGLTRRFLVRPGGMIWPGTLMSAAMFTTLHKEENTIANGWRITRWKFFFVVWISAFLFYFLPGLLMPALSYFSVITWFAPKNVIVANLFGVTSGLGLFPVTFDWAQIAYIGSPLTTPFWAAMNVVGGLVVVMWIIAPIAYYSNVFYSSYLPMLSSAVFDNTGNIYDVSKILTPDFLFDREAYQKYSRVFMPITYVLSYGLQFAALASLLSHTACWHGKDILKQWKSSLKEINGESNPAYQPVPIIKRIKRQRTNGSSEMDRSESNIEDIINLEDVHNRLMRKYKDAPVTWYLGICVVMTAIGIFVVE